MISLFAVSSVKKAVLVGEILLVVRTGSVVGNMWILIVNISCAEVRKVMFISRTCLKIVGYLSRTEVRIVLHISSTDLRIVAYILRTVVIIITGLEF